MFKMNTRRQKKVIVVFLKHVMILKGTVIKLLIYYAFRDMGGVRNLFFAIFVRILSRFKFKVAKNNQTSK